MKRFIWPLVLGLALILSAGQAWAVDNEELEQMIDDLTDEFDVYKATNDANTSFYGNKVLVFGYGELHFNVPTDGRQSKADQHRYVLGIQTRLTDWIQFNAEIDFEHAVQELEFELGHLSFLINPAFNVRTGYMLLPVGFLNEFHEPPLFWTVERPLLQRSVIPTTWSGAGAGFYGTPFQGVNYRFYVVNSIQSVRPYDFDGEHMGAGGNSGVFKASNGIRNGRSFVDEVIAEDFAVTGRVEFTNLYPGLQVAGSFYTGETTHDVIDEGGRTTLLEGDIQYRWNWFQMNATYAHIFIDDAADINDFRNMTGMGGAPADDTVAKIGITPNEIYGWNVQAGIHVPQMLGLDTRQDLVPYFLYEMIDLQADIPDGFGPKDPKLSQDVLTFGISYLPIPNVALKFDFTQHWFGDDTKTETANMAVSYMY
ncbi:MAG: hypothetical protein ACQ9MH_09715 [Nitrospinales bacterium]